MQKQPFPVRGGCKNFGDLGGRGENILRLGGLPIWGEGQYPIICHGFPVNILKLLKTHFLQNMSGGCLCSMYIEKRYKFFRLPQDFCLVLKRNNWPKKLTIYYHKKKKKNRFLVNVYKSIKPSMFQCSNITIKETLYYKFKVLTIFR